MPTHIGTGTTHPAGALPDRRRTVVVVGGGITGLAAAWELATNGPPATRVVVLEAAANVGGKLRTAELGGQPVDLAADAVVARRPEAVELCRELGLGDELVPPGTSGASVWARGRLRRLPEGLVLGVPTRWWPLARSGILGPAGLLRAAADLAGTVPHGPRRRLGEPGSDRSVGAVVQRRLGRQVVARLADPLIGGIHAGCVSTMSGAAVFPQLLAADDATRGLMRGLRATTPGASAPRTGAGPAFVTVRGGLGRLVERLVEALTARGVVVRTSTPVGPLRAAGGRWVVPAGEGAVVEADAVVLAVPAPAGADIVGAVDAALAAELRAIAYSGVCLVTMRWPSAALAELPEGTGFLVPVEQGLLLTAATWLSVKWPHLARPGEMLVRASSGRHGDDRAMQLDDDALVRRVTAELASIMRTSGTPLESMVTRWPMAFPQYAVGHLDRVARMDRLAGQLPAPLALAGAALHGVGVPACIGSGRAAARTVAAMPDDPPP